MNGIYCEQVVRRKKKNVSEKLAFWNKVVEYEYFVGDGELIIAGIYNKSRRKNKWTISISKIQELSKVEKDELGSMIKGFDYTSGMFLKDIYVIRFFVEGKNRQIFIEPNEEFLKCIKMYQ